MRSAAVASAMAARVGVCGTAPRARCAALRLIDYKNILGSTGRDIFARERHLAVVQDVTQGGAVDQYLERSVSSARDEPDAAVGDVGDDTLAADDVGHARVFRHLDDASV